jgi:hypothetical protein
LRVVYASPVDPVGWASGSVYEPPDFARFKAWYSAWFANPLDDGYAPLHHDAELAAFNYTGATATPVKVGEASQRLEFKVTAGTISLDQKENPVGKPIAALDDLQCS